MLSIAFTTGLCRQAAEDLDWEDVPEHQPQQPASQQDAVQPAAGELPSVCRFQHVTSHPPQPETYWLLPA